MIFTKIEKNIKHILQKKPTIILGLSGGPDSVFLLYFFKKLDTEKKIKLIAAHLDHGWRKESVNDVKFCKSLCKNNDIPFIHEHANNLKACLKFNGSKEEFGRNLRRFFFENLQKIYKADLIALGHHQQDQQETFFWRIIRGSSLCGLSCMRIIDKPYIRPLLNVSKHEILNYLNEKNINYITDSTNSSDSFLRNRIRKYVLPAMQKSDLRFNTKFQSTLKHLQEEEDFFKRLTIKYYKKIFTAKIKNQKQIICGDLKQFLSKETVLQKRMLIYWLNQEKVSFNASENYFDEILRFLNNNRGGSHQLCTNWKLNKKKSLFWIEKN
ncbi:tRNA lysidine(34) synthetase TilS [Candidatus Dependentiae bacterium]|nr:tRNA lysidine(34) synthetase TilS [Candidatus Dependentiae bacterium]